MKTFKKISQLTFFTNGSVVANKKIFSTNIKVLVLDFNKNSLFKKPRGSKLPINFSYKEVNVKSKHFKKIKLNEFKCFTDKY